MFHRRNLFTSLSLSLLGILILCTTEVVAFENKEQEKKSEETIENLSESQDLKKEVGTIETKNTDIEKVTKENGARWRETLKLKDFYLYSGTLVVRDKVNSDSYLVTLEKTYKEHPSVYSIAIQYGLALIDIGDFEKAEEVWNRAVKDFGPNPTPPVYKAWIEASMGNILAAKDVWFPIAKQKYDVGIISYDAGIWLPYHVDALLGLCLIKDYLPTQDREEIEPVINKILKHFGSNSKFEAARIMEDLRNGRITSAEKRLDHILKVDPLEPTLLTLQGIYYILTGNNEEALKSLDTANDIYKFSPTNHLMRARVLYAMKNKKDSSIAFEKAVKLDKYLNPENKKIDTFLKAKSFILSPEKKIKKLKKKENQNEVSESKKNVEETKENNVSENINSDY